RGPRSARIRNAGDSPFQRASAPHEWQVAIPSARLPKALRCEAAPKPGLGPQRRTMPQRGLVTSRVVVERNFALLPPEGIPGSVLPEWTKTEARILTAPP